MSQYIEQQHLSNNIYFALNNNNYNNNNIYFDVALNNKQQQQCRSVYFAVLSTLATASTVLTLRVRESGTHRRSCLALLPTHSTSAGEGGVVEEEDEEEGGEELPSPPLHTPGRGT